MTTPEQLAKWRKEFEETPSAYVNTNALTVSEFMLKCEMNGYLRAKQENEQVNEGVLFLAKFAAQTINSGGHVASHYPVVQATIKELLNEQ